MSCLLKNINAIELIYQIIDMLRKCMILLATFKHDVFCTHDLVIFKLSLLRSMEELRQNL